MRPWHLHVVTGAALLYAGTVAALAHVPAWEYLPDRPISISAVGCPSGPIALQADPELAIPLVVAARYDGGTESPASAESCRRVAELVRESATAVYDLVPDRFLCRSVRARAHEIWLEADANLGNHLWILDGRVTGAGFPGFPEELRAAGLAYAEVDGRVRIVRSGAP